MTTFASTARDSSLDVNDIRRFLRVVIARHVFEEHTIGLIAHTAASHLFVYKSLLQASVLNSTKDFWLSLIRIGRHFRLYWPEVILIVCVDGGRHCDIALISGTEGDGMCYALGLIWCSS